MKTSENLKKLKFIGNFQLSRMATLLVSLNFSCGGCAIAKTSLVSAFFNFSICYFGRVSDSCPQNFLHQSTRRDETSRLV